MKTAGDEIEVVQESLSDRYSQAGQSFQRLWNEYRKNRTLCIGYDFEGTVHDFEGVDRFPRIMKLLRELKEVGCKLYCYTTFEDPNYVRRYLEENKIPFDGINTTAINPGTPFPMYSAILDDRAGLRDMIICLEYIVVNVKLEVKNGA